MTRVATRTTTLAAALGLLLGLTAFNSQAESDKEIQERALKAREIQRHGDMDMDMDHGGIQTQGQFRGVFYGYLPCQEKDCDGVKFTLSLNPKNSYLLIIQPAKALNRETFEKGKYDWDDKQKLLLLNPNKEGSQARRLTIRDDGSLQVLNFEGKPAVGSIDRYLLKRSDLSDNREMHIH